MWPRTSSGSPGQTFPQRRETGRRAASPTTPRTDARREGACWLCQSLGRTGQASLARPYGRTTSVRSDEDLPVVVLVLQLLRDEPGQIGVVEGEHEPRVGIVEATDHRVVVVVVRDVQRVLAPAAHDDILAEREPFDLRWHLVGRDAMRAEDGDDVEKQRLRHGVGREIGLAGDAADVGGTLQIDEEDLLHLGIGSVAQSLAVTLVDQKLVIVDREDLADTRAGRQRIRVFAGPTAADVDADDPDGRPAVLDQR